MLKKAYDSVPRDTLWTFWQSVVCYLQRWVLFILFHEGMEGGVRMGETVTKCFEDQNGLRQGCIQWHQLFLTLPQHNGWSDGVVSVRSLEYPFYINMIKKLVGNWTAKSTLLWLASWNSISYHITGSLVVVLKYIQGWLQVRGCLGLVI